MRIQPACGRAAALAIGFLVASVVGLDATAEPPDRVAAVAELDTAVPEIHALDMLGRRRMSLVGTAFGDEPGQVLVGGKKARIEAWSDGEITLRTRGKLPGGVLAVEVVDADGATSPVPYPLVSPRRARFGMRVHAFGRSRSHRDGGYATIEDGVLEALFFRTTRRVREGTKVVKRRECEWRTVCVIDLGIGCVSRRVLSCHWVTETVPYRRRIVRTYTVHVHLPMPDDDLTTPRLFTSADLSPTDPAPIEYVRSKGDDSVVDPAGDDWWVLVGREPNGRICGQFRGVATDGGEISGRFVGLKPPR